jgi:hypothetical protein
MADPAFLVLRHNMLGNNEDSPLNSTLERAIGRRVRRMRAGDRHLACKNSCW